MVDAEGEAGCPGGRLPTDGLDVPPPHVTQEGGASCIHWRKGKSNDGDLRSQGLS